MDLHETLKSKTTAVAVKLLAAGADKPAPEESFGFFRHKGDMIYLVGNIHPDGVDLDSDYRVQKSMLSAMRKDLLISMQEVAEDGVMGALLRSTLPTGFGFDVTTDSEISEVDFLFSDLGTCAVVTVSMEKDEEFVHYMFDNDVDVMTLGHVTKGDLRIDDEPYGNIHDFAKC